MENTDEAETRRDIDLTSEERTTRGADAWSLKANTGGRAPTDRWRCDASLRTGRDCGDEPGKPMEASTTATKHRRD